ncbi:unnamed protein product, partial [marine sediment metagenome]
MRKGIRNMLIKAAQQRKVVYYSEVGEAVNLSMGNPHQRAELGRILSEISSEEHDNGRPLLAAIVVHKDNKKPGEGFFKLARNIGKQKPDEDNDTFCKIEKER